MKLPKHFISVDWGTTNFRMRLVETDSLNVLQEQQTNQGVLKVYEHFQQQASLDQQNFFANYLKQQVQTLPEKVQNLPLVLTGMASSSIGLKELDYANFPFHQNGLNLKRERLVLENGLEVLLISGVKSATGMMRGEEIQAVGLGEALISYEQGVLLLPGTHSKHLHFQDSYFTDLNNFMTGELFEVLSKKSILSNSVEAGTWTISNQKAFKKGLALGFEQKMSASLLQIRANDVIHHTDKTDNFYLLSGLIIGDEIFYLKNEKSPIFLAASSSLLKLYKIALKTLLPDADLVFFNTTIFEKALLTGQKKILLLHD